MSEHTTTIRPTTRAAASSVRARVCVVHGPEAGHIVDLRPGQRLKIGREPGPTGLRLSARGVSRTHCTLAWSAVGGVWRVTDQQSKNGTYVDGVKIDATELPADSVVRVGDALMVLDALAVPPQGLTLRADGQTALSRALAETLIDRVAAGATPVLVNGPSGAGKQRLAERLHAASGRPGPLVSVNCATFTRELLISELFGHVRGAFSGARESREGLFVQAHRGTLFLDEIAELPLDQQPALLRALQEGRIRPVGADREVAVDVRVIAATHADLDAMQAAGRFRADLFARLAGLRVRLPGLAERRVEILPLFRAMLGPSAPPLTADAAGMLLRHDWPLNVREIQQVAAHVRLFADGVEHIDPSLLPAVLRETARPAPEPSPSALDEAGLRALLTRHRGNVARAARDAGVARPTLYRMLKDRGLDPRAFRD